jgi:hypothetical protein
MTTIARLILVVAVVALCWALLIHTLRNREDIANLRKMVQQSNRQAALRTIANRAPCDTMEFEIR